MSTLNNPHDRFFRHAFAKRQVSQPFFEGFLAPEISAQLDFDTLELTKDSFIDDDLQTQQSDLLFHIRTVSGQPARLYLLLEHKSYPDRWVGLQLLGYLVRIWAQERQQGTQPPLPAVMAMVVYHGERAWELSPLFEHLIEMTDELIAYTPRFQYALCDLNQAQLDRLQQCAWLAVTLQVLKYVRSETLPERLVEILALFQRLMDQRDEALAFLATVLRYLAQAAPHLNEPLLRQALHQALPVDVGDRVMSTLAETWVEQGLKQGIEQGIEQGVEQGRLNHARQTLRRLLVKQFGPLSEAIDARIDAADQDTLDGWLEQLIGASSLDAVFIEIRSEDRSS